MLSLHQQHLACAMALLDGSHPWKMQRQAAAILWDYRLGFKRTKNILLQFNLQLGTEPRSSVHFLSTFATTKLLGVPVLPDLLSAIRVLFSAVDSKHGSDTVAVVLTLLLLCIYGRDDNISTPQRTAITTHASEPTRSSIFTIIGEYSFTSQRILRQCLFRQVMPKSLLNQKSTITGQVVKQSAFDKEPNKQQYLCISDINKVDYITPQISDAKASAIQILSGYKKGLREVILNSNMHNSQGDPIRMSTITKFEDLFAFIKSSAFANSLMYGDRLAASFDRHRTLHKKPKADLYLQTREELAKSFAEQYFGVEIMSHIATKIADTVLYNLYTSIQSADDQQLIDSSLLQIQDLETIYTVIQEYKDSMEKNVLAQTFSRTIEVLDMCVLRSALFTNGQSGSLLATFYSCTAEGVLQQIQRLIIAEVYRMYSGNYLLASGSMQPVPYSQDGVRTRIEYCLHGFEVLGIFTLKPILDVLFQRNTMQLDSASLIKELQRTTPHIWLPLTLKKHAGVIVELLNLAKILSLAQRSYPVLFRTLFLYTSAVIGDLYSASGTNDVERKKQMDTVIFSYAYEFYAPTQSLEQNVKQHKQANLSSQGSYAGVTGMQWPLSNNSSSSVPKTVSFLEQEQVRRSVADNLRAENARLLAMEQSVAEPLPGAQPELAPDNMQEKEDMLLPGVTARQTEVLAVLRDLRRHFFAEMERLGIDVTDTDVATGLAEQFKLLLAREAPSYSSIFERLCANSDTDTYKQGVAATPAEEPLAPGPDDSAMTDSRLLEMAVEAARARREAGPIDRNSDVQGQLNREDEVARVRLEERILKVQKREETRKIMLEREKTLPLHKRKVKTAKEVMQTTEYETNETIFNWDEYLSREMPGLMDTISTLHIVSSRVGGDTSQAILPSISDSGDVSNESNNNRILSIFKNESDVHIRTSVCKDHSHYMQPIYLLHKITNKVMCNYLMHETNILQCIDTIGDMYFLLDSSFSNRLLFPIRSGRYLAPEFTISAQRITMAISSHKMSGLAELRTILGSIGSLDVQYHSTVDTAVDESEVISPLVDKLIKLNSVSGIEPDTEIRSKIVRYYTSLRTLCNKQQGSQLPIHCIIPHKDLSTILAMYANDHSDILQGKVQTQTQAAKGGGANKDSSNMDTVSRLLFKANPSRAPAFQVTRLQQPIDTDFTVFLDFSCSNMLFQKLFHEPLEPLLVVVFKHLLILFQNLYSLHRLWFLLVVSDKDRKRYSAAERRTRKLLVTLHKGFCFMNVFIRFLLGELSAVLQNVKQCVAKSLQAGENVLKAVDQWHTCVAVSLAHLLLTEPHRTILKTIQETQRNIARFCNEGHSYVSFIKGGSSFITSYEDKLTEIFWSVTNAGTDMQQSIDRILECLSIYVNRNGVIAYEEVLAQLA